MLGRPDQRGGRKLAPAHRRHNHQVGAFGEERAEHNGSTPPTRCLSRSSSHTSVSSSRMRGRETLMTDQIGQQPLTVGSLS